MGAVNKLARAEDSCSLESSISNLPIDELPFDYNAYGEELLEHVYKRLGVNPIKKGFTYEGKYVNLIKKIKKTVLSALEKSARARRKKGLNPGDIFEVKSMSGTALDEILSDGATEYYYGGDEKDIPLGSEGELIRIISDDKYLVRFNIEGEEKEWTLHPDEVKKIEANKFKKLIKEKGSAKKAVSFLVKEAEEALLPKYLEKARDVLRRERMQGQLFVPLSSIGLDEDLQSFSLNMRVCEKEMEERYGRKSLHYLRRGHKLSKEEEELCNRIVPSFNGIGPVNLEMLMKNYKGLKFPCSMIVNDIEEMEAHISVLFQIGYAHYTLFKMRYGGKVDCTSGSRAVMQSLLSLGYPNVGIASTDWGHNYVMLPFVFKMNRKRRKGILGIDPASNRVVSFGKNMPKNAIYLITGKTLRYTLSSYSEVALFPDHGVSAIEKIAGRNGRGEHVHTKHYHNGKKFLKKAFDNPVELVGLPVTL